MEMKLNYEKSSFSYINHSYGLGAEKGRKIVFDGSPGVIVGADGQYLKIQLDGESKEKRVHPTWRMKYL